LGSDPWASVFAASAANWFDTVEKVTFKEVGDWVGGQYFFFCLFLEWDPL